MDEIRNWAFSICSAAICGAVMNIILPEGSTQKIFKSVFCVFFLCCVISPLLTMDFLNEKNFFAALEIEDADENSLESGFYEPSARIMEEEIRTKTENILRSENVEFGNISVRVNILESGGIEINEFSIAVYDIPESVKEKIGNETGLIQEVKIIGESF